MLGSQPRRRALSSALALAVVVPLAIGTTSIATAAPEAELHKAKPVNTQPTDNVLYRQSFNDLAAQLQARSSDPDIVDGTVGFTSTAPKGWSVENSESMTGVGVDEWRGWNFTTREFWVDAEDQMRNRFARADNVIAVADSDEFADRNNAPHDFKTTLVSEGIKVAGQSVVQLSFDSHYRGWAGQSATVTVEFDGSGEQTEILRYDSTTVTDNYDGSVLNANETVDIEVPEGAKTATFRWNFEAEANSWYWAIDSVSVREVLPAAAMDASDATSTWVVSDIQGQPGDLAHAFKDLNAVRPDASGLLMVGDIVAHGTEAQWNDVNKVMDDAAPILPGTVAAAIGNHESYTSEPFEVLRDRFLDFADRDRVWDEYVLEGNGGEVPALVLGQEESRPPEVPMSAEQLEWFKERLAYWTKQDKQILVISHFPLGDTASASWIPWYSTHYEHNDLLTGILGDYPNAVMLNGHTHYPFELGDWAVQRRTDGGHPDGFWAVNTGAIQVEWDARGENTEGISEIVTRDINRGLTIDVYEDRMVIDARDFGVAGADGTNEVNDVVRSVTIPNPLKK
ncbi:phosphohydrolase [Arthrobacter sp. JZ12]|uniref:metallophosphoesterase family protein n=1 Tax=Arthrobacter sp. JZ12 TaxID=2654190 RepID=UPI002B4A4DD7|nr:phosphohydrolase [Arthrobacter sp. JZ12]